MCVVESSRMIDVPPTAPLPPNCVGEGEMAKESVEKCLKDLKGQFKSPDPRFQTRRRFSVDTITGSLEIAFLRGYQFGIHDAYKKIRRKYPDAAKKILKSFSMRKDGSI